MDSESKSVQSRIADMLQQHSAHIEEYAAAFYERYGPVDPARVEMQMRRLGDGGLIYRIVSWDSSEALAQAHGEAMALRAEVARLRSFLSNMRRLGIAARTDLEISVALGQIIAGIDAALREEEG